jgi:hypothetical protein
MSAVAGVAAPGGSPLSGSPLSGSPPSGSPEPSGRGGRGRAAGLRLYGVAALGHVAGTPVLGAAAPLVEGTEVVPFRDVGAVVVSATYADDPLTLPELDTYRAVIDALFAERAVIPAPPGTVFRSRDALSGWLELHYFTLVEALNFVEDRVAARLTVTPAAAGEAGARRAAALRLAAPSTTAEFPLDDAAAVALPDAVALAAPVFAALRREAVSVLVLRPEGGAPEDAAHASFLVERGRWTAFHAAVAREAQGRPALRLHCTGPWPPYDFVRMQFAG